MDEEYFHNPHDTETEEQLAYEREMYAKQSRGSRDRDAGTADGERGLFSKKPSSLSGPSSEGGGSLGSTVKGLFLDGKAAVRSIKSFVALDTKLGKDIYDPKAFPEVAHPASVRRGIDLCADEGAYLADRRAHVRDHFARCMGWDPSYVHPEDVPTVAFGGSGGGYRAMLALLGYSAGMKETGLWDLLTYVSGVSGSCWAIGAYYTFGKADINGVIEHCKKRLSPHHPLSPDAIDLLLNSKNGDLHTLGPLIAKSKSGLHTVPMDLYAVFTTGYLFMAPDPILKPGGFAEAEIPGYHSAWWKLTDAKQLLTGGREPLPILTAIRHERPWKDWADPEHPFKDDDPNAKEHKDAADAWFQWFEMTPFEVGCDELRAWVPTWGFGRKYEEGKSVVGLPEQSLALLLGLCTSAPAGPLSSYLATIQRNLPTGFVGDTINSLASGVAKMWGKQGTAVFENHHPLHASNEYNFLFHYTPTPDGTPRPPGIENSPRIHLIDSGMDNNCPTYVMLHPSREVDVILNMDASSDVQKDTFPQRVGQIGYRRQLEFKKRRDIKPDPDTANPDRFKGMYAQIYDGTMMAERPATVEDSNGKTVTNPPADRARRDCTMVYLPLLPNERSVPGYDPSTAKFSGSYNLVWTPEQVDMIIKTSKANFHQGEDTVKEALFNAWQRKKWMREQREKAGMQIPPPPPGPPPQQQQPQQQLQQQPQLHPQQTPQGNPNWQSHEAPSAPAQQYHQGQVQQMTQHQAQVQSQGGQPQHQQQTYRPGEPEAYYQGAQVQQAQAQSYAQGKPAQSGQQHQGDAQTEYQGHKAEGYYS